MSSLRFPLLRSALVALPVLATVTLTAHPASAIPGVPGLPVWFGVSASGGVVLPDEDFANFQRDVRPAPAWGIEGRVGRGPWSLGARLLSGSTEQSMGTTGAGDPIVTDVKTSRTELVLRRDVVRLLGTTLGITASGGHARLSFDPSRVTVDDGSGGTLDVALDPIGTWSMGGGVVLERSLAPMWSMGIAADCGRYAFDTSHREGSTIVTEKTAFTDWGVRLVVGLNTPH